MKNFDETAFLTDVSQINWDRIASRPIDINVLVDDDWSNLFPLGVLIRKGDKLKKRQSNNSKQG